MSDSLVDLLATDAELDRIAARHDDGSRDLALVELAMLAAAVDDLPLPPVIPGVKRPPMTSVRKGGWALSVTVALMVTSSGIAAAVSNNPLGPLHYVTTQMWNLGPHDSGKLPGWEVDGAMPISTVPGSRVPVNGSGTTGSGADAGTSWAVASGVADHRLGTPDARRAGPPGSATGGQRGSGSGSAPGSGTGSRPPFSTGGDTGGRRGVNSGSHRPPRGGHGQQPPGNGRGPGSGSGGGGTPGDQSRPGDPGRPSGNRTHHSGNPSYGRVPVSGTGPCRVDRPDFPSSPTWSGPAESLHRCGSDPTEPHPPGTATGPGLITPPFPPPPPAPPEPAATGSQTRPTPEASEPLRSIP